MKVFGKDCDTLLSVFEDGLLMLSRLDRAFAGRISWGSCVYIKDSVAWSLTVHGHIPSQPGMNDTLRILGGV